MIKEKEAMDFRESKKVHKRSWGGEEKGKLYNSVNFKN